MRKIILPGVVAGIVMLVISMVLSQAFMVIPSVAFDYNSDVMRPWSHPLMSIFFFHPFILGIILAWAWSKSKLLFAGTTMQRGAKFGAAVWLIATLPGMFATWTSFNLSFFTVLNWTVSGLVAAVVAGMIFSRMNS